MIGGWTMNALCQYARPDRIRELQSVIERAVTLASGPSLKIPVPELHSPPTPVSEEAKSTKRRPVRSILAEVDRDQIVQALQELLAGLAAQMAPLPALDSNGLR